MSKKAEQPTASQEPRTKLIYHFCRMQLPGIHIGAAKFDEHMARTYAIYWGKSEADNSWEKYLDNFYPLDWFIACACLEGEAAAWDRLFAARAGRTDCLLVDALRARAVRLYPRDEERQDSAVTEFWSHLIVPEFLPGHLLAPPAVSGLGAQDAGHDLDLAALIDGLLPRADGHLYAEVIAAVERVLLTRVLRHTHGHQSQASELLGLDRATLRHRLRTLGLAVDRILTESPRRDFPTTP